MEVYNVPEHGHADAYLIQGSEPNSYLTSQLIEQFEAMYNEGAPELAVQQGLYYPTATNYGYICTGLESPGNWDDHQRFFGLDGQEIQYQGAQTDGVPYLYCYGYSESPYNPYNPYIPGAMIGVDGTYAGSEQYYSIPSYENAVSSPAYYPMVVQTTPDILSSSNVGPFNNTSASLTNRADGPGLKHNLSSASAAYTLNPSRIASNRTSSFTRGSEGSKVSAGPSKQHVTHGSVTSSGSSNGTSHVFQGRGTRAVNDVSHGKVWSNRNQVKVTLPSGNGLSSFGSSAQGRPVMDKAGTKIHAGRASDDVNGSPDALSEQNRGPRINKSKNQLCVKAYTNRAGDSDAQGNIIIYPDQYNKDDFPVDYVNAKFFVIKSYSEDDVHKSIKYNVWSSTTNGNRKLNIAYDDTQKIAGGEPGGCPIFLFFSVNASGQYCGVAEMTGPVDFHKDMDFWQQDKWCGSFPVKWHIIKDVPNPSVRHIILENNENKPVTNSRDTQEIKYKKGMEMLKVFKNHISKTSLLDDFMYYENRQKLLQEEKARLLIKTYGNNPYFIPLVVEPPRKLNDVMDLPPNEDEKITKHDDISSSGKNASTSTEQVLLDKKVNSSNIAGENGKFIATDEKAEDVGTLKIGSLSVNPKPVGVKPADGSPTNAQGTSLAKATVNTEPIKVNGFAKSAGGFLTIGTIPLKLDESGNKKG